MVLAPVHDLVGGDFAYHEVVDIGSNALRDCFIDLCVFDLCDMASSRQDVLCLGDDTFILLADPSIFRHIGRIGCDMGMLRMDRQGRHSVAIRHDNEFAK